MKHFHIPLAIAMASVSHIAYAQSEVTSGPAGQAQTANEAAYPGEIIVTATKRRESVQDISLSVTAVSGAALQTGQIRNLESLQAIVPGMVLGNDFGMAKLFVRGVGTNTSTTGSESSVAFHVDGAVVARPEAQLGSLFDVERIEVLRGPQGTLYGRNSVGGSLNVVTAKPTEELEGYMRATFGNYNNLVVEGAVGGELTHGIRARASFQTEDRDGFGHNLVTGNQIDDSNRRMARLHLQFIPSEKVDLLLTGEYYRQNDASGAVKFRRASFPGIARLPDIGAGGHVSGRDIASDVDPKTDRESYALTGTLNVELSDAFSVTNIANYRDFDSFTYQDLDVSSVVNRLSTTGNSSTIQSRTIHSQQFSNELQLKLDTKWLKGVFGLFYFTETQNSADNISASPYLGQSELIPAVTASGRSMADVFALCGMSDLFRNYPGGTPAPFRVCDNSRQKTDALAAFGRFTLDLGGIAAGLEGLTVKLGGRYSDESRATQNPGIVIARAGLGPVIAYSAQPAVDLPGGVVNGTYRKRSFKDFTPELGIEYRPSNNIMLYYTYSEGFKSGSGEVAVGSSVIVNPETIKNHDAGIKTTWLDRRLTINLSGFKYDLSGLQLNKTFNDPISGFVTLFQNAAEVQAYGAELEIAIRPTDNLRLSGSATYLHSTFQNFVTADPLDPRNISSPPAPPYNAVTNPNPTAFGAPGGGNIQLSGNTTRNSPRWTLAGHGEYDIPVGENLVTLRGDVSFRTREFYSEFNRSVEGTPRYALVDLGVDYTFMDKRMKVSAWVKNLTDITRASGTFALATARAIGVTYLPPRTYGVTAGYSF